MEPGQQHVHARHVSCDTCHANGHSHGDGLGCRGEPAGRTNAHAHTHPRAHAHGHARGHAHGHGQAHTHAHNHVQAHKHAEGHENRAGHSQGHGHRDAEAERVSDATGPGGGPQQGPDGAATPSASALASCQGFAAMLEHVTSGRFVAEVASPVGEWGNGLGLRYPAGAARSPFSTQIYAFVKQLGDARVSFGCWYTAQPCAVPE